jgi:hypothetical protein
VAQVIYAQFELSDLLLSLTCIFFAAEDAKNRRSATRHGGAERVAAPQGVHQCGDLHTTFLGGVTQVILQCLCHLLQIVCLDGSLHCLTGVRRRALKRIPGRIDPWSTQCCGRLDNQQPAQEGGKWGQPVSNTSEKDAAATKEQRHISTESYRSAG